jgi:glycerol-3-phosphate dehydrogenase subunit B
MITEGAGRALHYDVVVIGAGLAGLVSAARAAAAGSRVGVVAGSSGNLGLWSGLVGSGPPTGQAARSAARFFLDFTAAAGLPYRASPPDRPAFTVLSASGRPHLCAMLPDMAAAGDIPLWSAGGPDRSPGLLVVGFTELGDYPAGLISARAAAATGARVSHRSLSLGSAVGRGLAPRIAHLFDDQTWFSSFLDLSRRVLAPEVRGVSAIAFPPVLGLFRFRENLTALEACFGRPVFELPALPPSVPGQRLWRFWRHRLEAGGRTSFHLGRRVLESVTSGGRCLRVEDGLRRYEAEAFILATGGIAGGGLEVAPGDFFRLTGAFSPEADEEASLREPLLDLVTHGRGRDWLSWGVKTGRGGRPYPTHGRARPMENVFVAGWQLGGEGPDALLSIESGARVGELAARRAAGGMPTGPGHDSQAAGAGGEGDQ